MTNPQATAPQNRTELWRLQQLALVSQVATQVTSIYDLDELLVRVVGLIYQTFEFYAVSLYTLDKDILILRAQAGPSGAFTVEDAFIPEHKVKVPLGQGIIGWAAAHQQELVVTDVRREQRFRYSPEFPNTQAEIALPLKIEDCLLGVLDVQLDYPEDFDQSDLLVLRALAGQVSMAIEDTRLYAELRRRRDQLASISAVSWAVAFILDVDELLEQVSELIRKYFGYPCVQVFTVNRAEGQVEYRAGSGRRADLLKGQKLTYDLNDPMGVIPLVARSGQMVMINDVTLSPVYRPFPNGPIETRAELAVPLIYGDNVLGVLDVQSDVVDAFTEENQATMSTLAANIAVALRNATLYHSERWRRQVADSLRRISGVLIADVELTSILDTILTELQRNLSADVLAIWLRSNLQTGKGQDLYLAMVKTARAFELAPEFDPEQDPWLALALTAADPLLRESDQPADPIAAGLGYPSGHSAIAAPLRVVNETVGLLTLAHREAGVYGHEARVVTTAFANQAAIAIENARLYRLAQEEAQINDALLKVAETIQGFSNLGQVLAEVTRIPPLIAGLDRCAIWLRQVDTNLFEAEAAFGFDPVALAFLNQYPVSAESVVAVDRLNQTHAPIIITEAAGDDRLPPGMVQGLKLQTLVLLPIVAHNEMLGLMLVTFTDPAAIHQESVRLITGVAHQAAVAIESKYLYEQKAEQERMAHELELARDIQVTFIPGRLPAPPGWDIAACWQSAQEVSGDFYDIIEVTPHQLGIVMADVAGKGMPAALYMVQTRSLVRAIAPGQTDPRTVLRRANQLLIPDTRRGMFVSLFYAILNMQTGSLAYANAGHNLPLLVRANGKIEPLQARGLVLGVRPEIEPQLGRSRLNPGDGVVFYTDGVTEVFDAAGDIFGEERLKLLLQRHWTQPPQTLVELIRQHVDDFSATALPYDDFTLLILKRNK
ncbi:MAG: SpoIIE family protein phosphatase [Chloroflexota bacterium]